MKRLVLAALLVGCKGGAASTPDKAAPDKAAPATPDDRTALADRLATIERELDALTPQLESLVRAATTGRTAADRAAAAVKLDSVRRRCETLKATLAAAAPVSGGTQPIAGRDAR